MFTFQKELGNLLIYWNQNNIVRKKWWQKVLSPVSYGFLFLRISENLWWSSLKSIFCKINICVVGGTMVFLFGVWMGVLFKINTVFANSLFCWNKKSAFCERMFFVVCCTMVFPFVIWMRICLKLIQFLQIRWFTRTKITLAEGNYGRNFYILFVIGCIWYENFVFYFFSAHTGKSYPQSYIFICFVKLMKNNFIEFLSWILWKMISLNHEDLLGRLAINTSQSFFQINTFWQNPNR